MARMPFVARRGAAPIAPVLATLIFAVACASKTTPPPVLAPAEMAAPGPALLAPPLEGASRGTMARELDALFGAPSLRTAVLSVLVQSLDSGEVLYRLNPDTLVLPASNQKIVTTAIAAAHLGWDFRFETRLEASAPIDGGVLHGDLFVVGTGDPTINARESRRDTAFDEMAAALGAAGISRVDGRLVGDDRAWADEPYGDGLAVGRPAVRLLGARGCPPVQREPRRGGRDSCRAGRRHGERHHPA